MLKLFLILAVITAIAVCGSSSSNSNSDKPMPVGALMNEYSAAKEATKTKYTGKTLTVQGYVLTAPVMPTGANDDGILIVMEKGGDMLKTLTCSFSAADKAAFSKISGDPTVTIRGVFNDELSTGLKSCKVVEVE